MHTIKVPEGTKVLTHEMLAIKEDTTEVILPESLEIIDEYAFSYAVSLKNIVLPKNLRRIEDGAFYMSNIKTINFPESLEFIGKRAFVETDIEQVQLDSVKLSEGCFANCKKIKKVKILNIDSIPEAAFMRCSNLEALELQNVNKIESQAFQETNLKNIDLSSVSYIGDSAFYICPLKSVKFTEKDLKIEDYAFAQTLFESLEIKAANLKLGSTAFASNAKLKTVNLKETKVDAIPDHCFDMCISLKTVVLPPSVKAIKPHAFQCCFDLTNINLENVEYLDECFSGSFSLKEIDLSNFKEIKNNPFKYCFNITFTGNSKNYKIINNNIYKIENGKYKLVTATNENIAPCTEILTNAFATDKIEKITLPKEVKKIHKNAFICCRFLKTIDLNCASKIDINEPIITTCSNLETIYAPNITENPKLIYDCRKLKEIFVNKIAYNAYKDYTQGLPIDIFYEISLDKLLELGKSFKEINEIKKNDLNR